MRTRIVGILTCLAMGALAPRNGASPAVLRLAERISAGQKDEIATMQQWLRDRGEPVPDDFASRHGLGDWKPIMTVEGLA